MYVIPTIHIQCIDFQLTIYTNAYSTFLMITMACSIDRITVYSLIGLKSKKKLHNSTVQPVH